MRCTSQPSTSSTTPSKSPAIQKDEDDRPPIIVTNGSVNFDDGDPNDSSTHPWKDWTKSNGNNNKKQWTQNNPRGFDVASFDVTIAGSTTTTSCNGTTKMVSAVAIEYSQASGATSLIAIQRSQWSGTGNKREPWVTASVDMSTAPKVNGKPDRLTFEPDSSDKGYISYVVLFTSSAPTACAFSQPPPSGSDPVSIRIQPVK